jgi:hypothetical protein
MCSCGTLISRHMALLHFESSRKGMESGCLTNHIQNSLIFFFIAFLCDCIEDNNEKFIFGGGILDHLLTHIHKGLGISKRAQFTCG